MSTTTTREHALLDISPMALNTFAVSEAAKLAALDPYAVDQALAEARGLPPKAARASAKLKRYIETYRGTPTD